MVLVTGQVWPSIWNGHQLPYWVRRAPHSINAAAASVGARPLPQDPADASHGRYQSRESRQHSSLPLRDLSARRTSAAGTHRLRRGAVDSFEPGLGSCRLRGPQSPFESRLERCLVLRTLPIVGCARCHLTTAEHPLPPEKEVGIPVRKDADTSVGAAALAPLASETSWAQAPSGAPRRETAAGATPRDVASARRPSPRRRIISRSGKPSKISGADL